MKRAKLPQDFQIDPAQWDFSQCPESQLSFCLFHEYGRQFAMAYRVRLREAFAVKLFYDNFNYYFKDGERREFKDFSGTAIADPLELNLNIKRRFAYAVCSCTGFPDLPFLKIPLKEREDRMNALGLDKFRPDRPDMLQMDFSGIERNPNDALTVYAHFLNEWRLQTNAESGAALKNTDPIVVDFDGFKFEMGVIRINWSLSNKKIVEAFAAWVEKNRPAKVAAMETRGATSIREKLKYLSALRLIQVMSPSKAHDLTAKLFKQPFYYEETDWYQVKDKANQVMQELLTPFFTFKK